MTDAAGAHALAIERLWWGYFWVSVVVYVLVVAALLIALFRKRNGSESLMKRLVTAAGGVTIVTLFALLIASIFTGRTIAENANAAVTIELTGHQWWWQVDYDHEDKSKRFSTANEFAIPVGEPVLIKLRTADVIHSFWIPALHGKQDLITGHDGTITLKAERAGAYRGQCAEFCGIQHAKMAIWVTALPKAEYVRWAESQRQLARDPSTPRLRHGQEVFLRASCTLCHTIAGTPAAGKVAPDLTHIGSRRWLAAATLPNRAEFLRQWIVDPQHIKPGSNMPATNIAADDLTALAEYLESLR
jgi:cytochrome c oxidase subunit II